jgi:hypothetical protein
VVKVYADRPGIGLRQVTSDLLVLAWVVFWIWLGTEVYDAVMKLAVPGQKIEGAGERMAGGLSDASAKVNGIPAVGDELASPFDQAAGAARALAEAGRDQQEAVHNLAVLLVVLLLAVPLSLVLFVWLPVRIRWVQRASYAAAIRGGRGGQDLLALRALANQPLRRLATVHPEPASAWRDGDESVIQALAAMELRSLGLAAS